MMPPEYDYSFKVIIVGDSGVGKTSLLVRFSDDFYTKEYISTIGVDFKIRTLPYNDKLIRMQFWDTAGQERFRAVAQCFFRSANGVILVYDVTDMRSFLNIESWMRVVEDFCSDRVALLVIGNKSDCLPTERAVSLEQGIRMASQFNAHFAEVSAAKDINVRQSFLKLGHILAEQSDKNEEPKAKSSRNHSTIEIDFDSNPRKKGKGSMKEKLAGCCGVQ